MSAWAEADALKAALAVKPRGEWRAFALVEMGEHAMARGAALRFRGRQGDLYLKLERPCYFARGKWRSMGRVRASHIDEDLAKTKLSPASLLLLRRGGVPAWVLVARDAWLDLGAPRMTRPRRLVLGTPPAPSPAHGPTDGGGETEGG